MAGSDGIFDGRFPMVIIEWVANPFRADRLEETWLPAAEAVTRYGARAWAFIRSKDDPIHFTQIALFPTKLDFERYWLSDEIGQIRTQCQGLYQVPLLPVWYEAVEVGVVTDDITQVENGEAA
jgi:hypothetical protein